MSEAIDIVERLRDMAASWQRWGADGIFKGKLHSDTLREAADALEQLEQWKKSHCSCEIYEGEIIRPCFFHEEQASALESARKEVETLREAISPITATE